MKKRVLSAVLALVMVFTLLPAEALAAEEKISAQDVVILRFDALAQTEYEVPYGAAQSDIGLPDTLAVSIENAEKEAVAAIVENVTWNGDYDANQAGIYSLSAYAEGYALAEGVTWPSVTMTILSGEPEQPTLEPMPEPAPEPLPEPDEIDALNAAIDALPELDYSDVDMEDEEVFAAWLSEQYILYAEVPSLYERLTPYMDDTAAMERIGAERADKLTGLYTMLFDTALMADTSDNWTDNAAGGYARGSGSSSDPYIIETAAQLAYLSQQANNVTDYSNGKYFKLGANIDLSAYYWTPIGHDDRKFEGHFDGANYTIYGMNIVTASTINRSGKWLHVGFFGRTDEATIKNVNLVGATIKVIQKLDHTVQVGGVGGYICNSDVTNCSFNGTIYAAFTFANGKVYLGAGNIYAGGIVGRTFSSSGGWGSNFTDCAAFGSITADSSSAPSGFRALNGCLIGGIGGETSWGGTGDGIMTNCYANSTLEDKTVTFERHFGGVVGYTNMRPESTEMYYRYPEGAEKGFGYIQSGLQQSAATYIDSDDGMRNAMKAGLPSWNHSSDVNGGYPIPAALYDVTYIANGGSGDTTGKAAFGYPLTLPAAPTREGYTFTGWYDDASGGTQYEAGNAYLRSEGITLYAHWSCNHSWTNACDTECNTCGESRSITHNSATDAAVPATCTEAGKTAGSHCSVCNTVITAQETVPVLGHDYKAVVTAPTCTAQGYTTHTCSRCSDSYVDDVDPTGHTSVADAAVAATCTKTGLTEGSHCSVCDEIIVAQNIVPATGHSWGTPSYQWNGTSCTAQRVCDRTGCSHKETETAAASSQVTQSKTCTLDELSTYTATFINTAFTNQIKTNVKTADKLGHNIVTDAAVPATCTATGLTEGSHCSKCDGATVTRQTVSALGHDYAGTFTTDIAATCTMAGSKSKHCSRCDSKTEVTAIAAIGHTWGGWVSNGDGTETRTCARDGSHKDTRNSTFSISYAGMNGATPGTNHPNAHTYGTATAISDPTKTGYTFAGWKVNDGDVAKNLTLAANSYKADITLTAIWTLNAPTVRLAATPSGGSVTYGTSVTLTATPSHGLTSGLSYNYAWYKGNVKIGGTENTLTLNDAADSGSYTVAVMVNDGNQTSATAISSPVSITISAAAHAKPDAPSFASKTYNSITVTVVSGQKYICLPAADAAPITATAGWNDSGSFADLSPNTAYKIYTYQTAADGNHKDSAVSDALEVSTDKVKIIDITAPGKVTLTDYYTTGDTVKAKLPASAACTSEDRKVTSLNITWTAPGTYNPAPSAANTFTWSVSAPADYEFASNVTASDSVTVTNKAATEVTITGTNKEITYNNATYDVSQMFSFGTGAGAKTYTVESGGSGAGELHGGTLTITKAGTIKIKVTTAASGNYAPGSAEATLTVKPASGAGAVSMSGYTYGGMVSAPSVSSNTGAATYYYNTTNSNSGGTKWENIGPTKLNANTYWMYAEIAATDLYSAYTTAVVEFTVGNVKLTPSVASVTAREYDGGTDATGTISLAAASGYTMPASETPLATGTFEWTDADAETATVNVTGIALTNADVNKNYELNADSLSKVSAPGGAKISPKGLTIPEKSLEYNGTTTYTVTGFATDVDSETITLTYTPAAKGADEYTHGAASKGYTLALSDDNYSVKSAGMLTITSKVLTAPAKTVTYNGNTDFTEEVDGVNDEKVTITYTTYSKNAGGYVFSTAAAAGKYTVTPDSANYTVTGGATLTIGQLEAVLSWSGDGETTFDGTPRSVTAEVINKVEGDKVSVTVTGGAEKNAGATPYTATATALTGDDAANYKLPSSKTTTYTIKHKSITDATITLGPALTYNGGEQTQTVAKVEIDDLTATFTVDGNTGTDAGSDYSLTVTGNGNFTGTKTATWGIAQKDLTITAKAQTITYGDSIATGTGQVEVSGLADGDELDSVTLTPSGNEVAGDKTITPSAAVIKDGATPVTSNYSITYNTGVLNINPATMSPVVSGYTGDYDGAAHGISVTMADADIKYGTESGTYDQNASPTYTDADEYTVYYQVMKANHTTVTGSATVKIIPKEIAAAWGNTVSFTYDGNPHAPTATAETGMTGETITLSVSGAATDYNADAYTATASITSVTGGQGKSSNYTLTDTTQDFTITKATLTDVSASQSGTLTYTGLPQTATVETAAQSKGNQSVSFTYSAASGGTYGDAVPVFTAAGAHTVYYRASAANHNETTGSFNVNIGRATLTLGFKDGLIISKIYDGDKTVDGDKTDWLVVKGLQNDEKATASGTWEYDSADVSGSRTVSVTGVTISYGTADANNYSYTYEALSTAGAITDATMNPTVSGYTGDYDGKAHGITVTMDGADIKYGTDGVTYDLTSSPTYTDAGTYTVYYQVMKANHTTVTGSETVKITPKALTTDMISDITAPTYNGGEQIPTPKVSWTPSGGSLLTLTAGTGEDFTFSYADNINATLSTAATKAPTVTITAVKNGNYSGSASKTFTIDQLTATLEWSDYTGLVYDGDAKNVTAAVSNLQSQGDVKDSCTVTVSGGDKTDAGGPYTATAAGLSNANYKLPTANTQSYSITSAPLTVGFKDGLTISKIYDGDKTVDGVETGWLEVKGLQKSEKATASGTWSYNSADVSDSRTVSVTNISISYDTATAGNYTYTQTDIEITGAITNATMTPTVSGYTGDYDSAAHGISVTMADAEIKYGTESGTYDQNASPTYIDAGEYTVYYQVTKVNHTTVTGSATVKITPKALTADMIGSITDPTYNGKAQTPTPMVSWTPSGGSLLMLEAGVSKDFTFSYSNNTNAATTLSANAPSVTITAADGGNYSGNVSKNFTIDQLTATLEWSGYTGLVYDGKDKTVTATVSNKATGDGDGDFGLVYSDNIQKDADNYTATVTALGNPNYALPADPTFAFTIAKAPISFTVTDNEYTYNAEPRMAMVTQTAGQTPVIAEDKFSVSYQLGAETTTTSKTDTGEYAIIVTLTDGNFCFIGGPDEDTRSHTLAKKLTIGKKPVTAQWKNLIHVYDGTDKTPEFVINDGDVFSADSGEVSAELGANTKTDAGTYTVTASLSGDRAAHYELTNPTGSLIIQRAPVTFTVRDNSVQHDSGGHTATVSATANGVSFTDFTISYKNGKGETVGSPTDAGSYDIYAAITGAGGGNYRHADAADGAARKIGVLTIYRAAQPQTYTVSFAGGEGATGGMNALPAALSGTPRILPENPESGGFTKDGSRFGGWRYGGRIYQPGEALTQPAANITLTAVWIEATYLIEGVVDEDGNPLADVVITLMLGHRQIAQTETNGQGKYSFTDVAPGLYNLVASKNGVTKTILFEIVAGDETDKNIAMPAQKTNSVVEVAAGSPAIVVGELEKTFSPEDVEAAKIGSVEMKLTAEAVAESADGIAIESKASGTVGLLLDVTLTKTVTVANTAPTVTALTESPVLLQIVIQLPGKFQRKDAYTVYRVHNGVTEALTSSPNENGEYIEVNAKKTAITVYAKCFSTYAIAFTSYSDGGTATTTYKPVITPTEHGSITVRPAAPVAGAKVTITLSPDEGYEPASVKVTDINGKEIALTQNNDGTYSFTQPVGSVTITARFRAAWNPFADVKQGNWFHDDVRYVYERKLMQGTGETTFSPHADTTRGMIVTILWRMENEPKATEAMTFTDVAKGKYYYDAIAWAAEHGIVEGYDALTFGPDNPITREQMAAILYRYAKYKGYDVTATADLSKFTDADKIGSWATTALSWANTNELITGKGNNILDPQGSAERCQVAAILHRFCENIVK